MATTYSLGFFGLGMRRIPNHTVLCHETLASEAMKPAKFKRHLETKHKEYFGETYRIFFSRIRNELKKHMMKEAFFFTPGENAKATEAS